jgi:hypothetical protein
LIYLNLVAVKLGSCSFLGRSSAALDETIAGERDKDDNKLTTVLLHDGVVDSFGNRAMEKCCTSETNSRFTADVAGQKVVGMK